MNWGWGLVPRGTWALWFVHGAQGGSWVDDERDRTMNTGYGWFWLPVPPHLLFVIQCSAGRRRFFRRPCSTERTEGRWTSCSTKRWDCQERVWAQSLPYGPPTPPCGPNLCPKVPEGQAQERVHDP